ncbi:bryoporin-like [Chanos chanos]|uniref:Bryoporin-like n=1 Tax=Chanos chanos TaxID=29144 RepID=A0A6J2UU76_CHACN|nr:bryoporin-like [Chanos chanos]
MITTVAAVISAATIAVAAAACRSCVIGIENSCCGYSLTNPKFWMHSGYNDNPLSPNVDPRSMRLCSFSKFAMEARGAAGVLTYDLQKNSADGLNYYSSNKLIAVMFSVPFDYNFYENWLAVGIFDQTQTCDEELFNLMYYGSGTNFKRGRAKDGEIKLKIDSVEIKAAMSNEYMAILRVEVSDNCKVQNERG